MAIRRRRGRDVAVGIVFFLINMVAEQSVQARKNLISSDKLNRFEFDNPPKGTVKTIQSDKNGDVVDCVDIYKQPAFDHSLLKNHTIQMKPSWFLENDDDDDNQRSELGLELEDWSVDCPEGTIPITRKTSEDSPNIKRAFDVNRFKENATAFQPAAGHEYAQVSLIGSDGSFRGARATHNLWTPFIETPGEISISQIWVIGGPSDSLNTVEAGWIVGYDSETNHVTRLFTYWTSDNYRSTGCYNLKCPGFVQTSRSFGPGSVIKPVSVFGGKQAVIQIEIKQDLSTGNWWLRVKNVDVGYWPGRLFTSLRGGARLINWGGEITNGGLNGRHTKTQMGSGHLPREGFYTKSALISDIGHSQGSGPIGPTPSANLVVYVTKPQCYDLVKGPAGTSFGTHVYFGGPGLSPKCPT